MADGFRAAWLRPPKDRELALLRRVYGARTNAKRRDEREAGRVALRAHPVLLTLGYPSAETFERVIDEVPEANRRACFWAPRDRDPLWPLAQWLRVAMGGHASLGLIGALYGVTGETVRYAEQAAFSKLERDREYRQFADLSTERPTVWDEIGLRG